MRILILAPHPDDELIGCGGSIIKHLKKKHEVSVIYMTSGDMGSAEMGGVRETEAKQAAKFLGINSKHQYFLRQKDGFLTPDPALTVRLAGLIRKIKPNLVYLPHSADAHMDHRQTHKIGLEALEHAALSTKASGHGSPWNTGNILAYEVWSPITNAEYIEEITSELDQKISALRLHKSQFKIYSYDKLVESLATYRGVLLGKNAAAEAFQVLKIESSSLI